MTTKEHKLIQDETPPTSLLTKIAEHYEIDINDRPALCAVVGSLLKLRNSWNDDSKDPIGHLGKCFAGEIATPFYARHKSPEGEAFEANYAQLHNAKFALATSSGESAISLVIQALTQAGETILVSEKIFGTSKNNFKITQEQDGRKIVFTTLHDLEAWEEKLKTYRPKLIFLESPSNPHAELADIKSLQRLAKEYDALLVVDSTYAPGIIYQPLKLGADVVLESATKFIDGQTRVTGGVIAINNQQWFDKLFRVRNAKGYNQVSFNALSLLYNLRSLEKRILTQSQNASQIATALKLHPKVEKVLYLGLNEHPQHHLALADFEKFPNGQVKGFGSMIAFTLNGDLELTKKAGNATGISVRANLGSVNSILTHPITSTHSRARLTPEDINAAGVTDNLLRLSVGMEAANTIIQKLEKGLAKL